MFKTDSITIILSKAKDIIIRRPDPSASPQDDTKCHFGHLDLFRISCFEFRIFNTLATSFLTTKGSSNIKNKKLKLWNPFGMTSLVLHFAL